MEELELPSMGICFGVDDTCKSGYGDLKSYEGSGIARLSSKSSCNTAVIFP
jgi:hypothetical protein